MGRNAADRSGTLAPAARSFPLLWEFLSEGVWENEAELIGAEREAMEPRVSLWKAFAHSATHDCRFIGWEQGRLPPGRRRELQEGAAGEARAREKQKTPPMVDEPPED